MANKNRYFYPCGPAAPSRCADGRDCGRLWRTSASRSVARGSIVRSYAPPPPPPAAPLQIKNGPSHRYWRALWCASLTWTLGNERLHRAFVRKNNTNSQWKGGKRVSARKACSKKQAQLKLALSPCHLKSRSRNYPSEA